MPFTVAISAASALSSPFNPPNCPSSVRAQSSALCPALPVRSRIATSSASVRLCGPRSISFSRGRSSSGQSLMGWYFPAMTRAYLSCPGFLLQDSEQEAFQVFAFGMMQAHGVIGRGAEALKDRYLAPRVDGRAEDDLLKEIERH